MSSPLGYDGGSGESDTSSQVSGAPEAGTTAPDVAPDTSSDAGQASTAGTEAGDNPKWAPFLNTIPSQFHNVVKPQLKEWDKSYNELARNYAPYKQFSQQGIGAEDLANAHKLYTLINTNPQEVLRRLSEALGQNQQQNQQEQQQDPFAEEVEQQQTNPENDPRYQQLQQQFQQMQQQVQQQQQQMMTEQYTRQLDSDIKKLQGQNPNVDVKDVMNRFLAQMQRGEQPSIDRAYQEQQAFVQGILAQQQSRPNAPVVMSPNGGMPSNTEQISTKSQEDRIAAVKAMLEAASQ